MIISFSRYTIPDEECEPGYGLKLLLPRAEKAGGSGGGAGGALTGQKRGRKLRLVRDELSWHGAKKAWAAESSSRRDDALCSAAQAAAHVVAGVAKRAALKSAEDAANGNVTASSSVNASTAASISSLDGSGSDNDNHPAPGVALAAGIRLCNLVGVPSNLDGLLRLRRRYLLDRAVVDLVAFRARDTPAVTAAVAKATAARAKMTAAVREDPATDLDPAAAADAYAAGLAAAAAAASTPISEDAEVMALRSEAAWCECLTVACGAHLHWHLCKQSSEYAAERCRGEATKPGTSPGGWPPEYDVFAASLFAPRSARDTFRAGSSSGGGGQDVAKAVTRQIMAARLEPTMLGLGVDPLIAHPGEALATGSLVSALMRCVGALRARQLKSDHGVHHAAWAIAQAEQHRRKVQAEGSGSGGGAAAATAATAAASPSTPTGASAAASPPPPTPPAAAAAAAAASSSSSSARADPPGLTFHVDRAAHGAWDEVPLQALDACTFALFGAVWCQFQGTDSSSTSGSYNGSTDRGSGSGSFRGDTGSSSNSFDGKSRGAAGASSASGGGACPSRKRHGAAVLAAALHVVVHGGALPSPHDELEPASPLSPGSAKSSDQGRAAAAGASPAVTSPGPGGGAVGAAGRALRGLAARLACFLLAREPWLRHSVSSDFGLLPGLAKLLWSRDAGLGLCGATLLAACVAHPNDRAQAARVDCAACLAPLLRFILVRQAQRRAGNAPDVNNEEGNDSAAAAATSNASSSSGNNVPRKGRSGPRRASEVLASPPPKRRAGDGSSLAARISSSSSSSGGSEEFVEALRGPDGRGAADALDHAFVALHGLLYALLHNKPSLGEMAARRNARRTGGHDSKHHHHHHHHHDHHHHRKWLF